MPDSSHHSQISQSSQTSHHSRHHHHRRSRRPWTPERHYYRRLENSFAWLAIVDHLFLAVARLLKKLQRRR